MNKLNHPTTDSRNTYGKKSFFSDNRGSFRLNVVKIVALSTILGISGLFSFASSTPVFADSLTLTISSSPLSLDLNPSVDNGFATTSGTFNVKTINSSGYTVSIKSKNEDGSNSLVSGENKLNSITEATTEETFKSDPKFTNMWGWLPNKLNSEDNSSYQVAPGIEEVVLDKTEEANESGTDYNISLAAKVASDTPTGKYENTFVVSATSNELPPDGIMQEWDGCDGLEPEQSVRLLDNRDNNVYTVTKLKDGKCWMTENLRITGDSVKAAGVSVDLNSTNTDISGSGKFTIPDSDVSKFNVGSNSYSITTGKNNDAAYVATTSYSDPTYGAKSFDSGYYTWHTATAGTGTADQTTQGWNAPSSICPKGWKLPTGGSGGDFQTLTNAYSIGNNAAGSNTLRGEPLNFTYAGYVDYSNGVLGDQGSGGDYWSSTVNDQYYAYNLYFYSSDVDPTNNYRRPNGFSVRCVAKEYKSMQKVSEWYDEVKTGKNIEAKDERDGSIYTVAKLNDGKIWMTQNLAITGSSSFRPGHSPTLTSSDSDVSSDYTIPTSDISKFNVGSDGNSTTEGKNNDAAYVETVSYTDSVHGAKSFKSGYYTWYTATAGTGTASMTSSGQNATSSICPKDWKLPTGGEGGDFQTLTNAYNISSNTDGSNILRGDPLNFTYAGLVRFSDGSMNNQGSYGYYWSSTVYGMFQAYQLDFYSKVVYPTYTNYRPYGISVRCVARKPKTISDLQYMQDWNDLSNDEKTQVTNSMEDGKNYTLTDKRDNTQYTISKLQDGEIWMTQNLRIGSNSQQTVLNSDTSDVASSFTLPQGTTKTASSKTDTSGWHSQQYDTSHIYIDTNNDYGGHYTWFAATAGEGKSTMSSGDTTHSICPKGWRLPTNNEITTLTQKYNTTTRDNNPPNFGSTVWAGFCDEVGCPRLQGSAGYWWSSTASASVYAYSFYSDSSCLWLTSYYKGHGNSVRCVAREPSITIIYSEKTTPDGCLAYDIPEPQSVSSTETNITLSDKTPTSGTYNFLGWCSTKPNESQCNGQIYQPAQSIPLSGGDEITLYAIWEYKGSSGVVECAN